jgi:membrane protein implicated in regulation of membrane protease activity
MAALIGASVLLIAGSAIVLIVGWITAEAALIWTSIVATVAAGVLLALGYARSKQELQSRPKRKPPAENQG